MNALCLMRCDHALLYPGYQRFFSRAVLAVSVLAEGRHIFGRRPMPRAAKPREKHYKDLTETGNRARKVSGTQGSFTFTEASFIGFVFQKLTIS